MLDESALKDHETAVPVAPAARAAETDAPHAGADACASGAAPQAISADSQLSSAAPQVSSVEPPDADAPPTAPRKFYDLSIPERLQRLAAEGQLDDATLAALGRPDPLSLEMADRMIENVVGVLPLPLGIARNFVIDGRPRQVPLAIEEPSVVAAASHGAKLLAAGGGIATSADPPHMVGQIFLTAIRRFEAGAQRLSAAREEIVATANARHPRLVAAGGGVLDFEVRTLEAREDGWIVVFELLVDVRNAMGANVINSMCEAVAPIVADALGGRIGIRILTNLCDRRRIRAEGRVPSAALGGRDAARAIADASLFAELDAYRACTHNKGVMNGVDAVLLACGQDWRAAEAGAHAFAAREGRYRPLSTWRLDEAGDLRGHLELPLAVGLVGSRAGIHPGVCAALALLGAESAEDVARVATAAGLAQNLAAIRALALEGILRGHMALHHRTRAPSP